MVSIPYIIYPFPHIFPAIPYIYYNLISSLEMVELLYFYNYYYLFYKKYLVYLLNTSDLFIIQNYFIFPEPFNNRYLPWNQLQKWAPNKYNFKKYNIKSWKVQYDLEQYLPHHLTTWYYYLKYRVYYNYLYMIISPFSPPSRSYNLLLESIEFRYKALLGTQQSQNLLDFSTMVYAFTAFCWYIQKGHKLHLYINQDVITTIDIDELVEDHLDLDLEYVDSEEWDAIDALEYEQANDFYRSVTNWTSEFQVFYDQFIDDIEYLDKTYIESEIELENKFNQLLIRENQYDLYKKSSGLLNSNSDFRK